MNVEITDGHRKKVVHVNRIQPRILTSIPPTMSNDTIKVFWILPQTEVFIDCEIEIEPPAQRNPSRQHRSPDYYRPEARGRA